MKKILLTILLLSLSIPNLANAYPPDNAAVIYYQQMVDFSKPEDVLWDQIFDATRDKIKINQQIQQYLESQQPLVYALETASNIPNCDWGLDFSQGLALEVPHLSKMRGFTNIILADSMLKNQQGQYKEALNLCLTNLRMANHVGNAPLMSYLVGTAMSALSYGTIGNILPNISTDEMALIELQREFELPKYNILNIKTSLLSECGALANEIITMSERKKELLRTCQDYELYKEEFSMLINADDEFRMASAEYYKQFFDKYIAALDQPYKQAIKVFKELENTPKEEYEAGNKEAFATALLAPATIKVYDIDIRRRTHKNALSAAIQLYRYYAKNGTLPEKLPVTLPKDLFSGQPFEYEKTDDGFTLRCRQADLKDKTNEYVFKLPN